MKGGSAALTVVLALPGVSFRRAGGLRPKRQQRHLRPNRAPRGWTIVPTAAPNDCRDRKKLHHPRYSAGGRRPLRPLIVDPGGDDHGDGRRRHEQCRDYRHLS